MKRYRVHKDNKSVEVRAMSARVAAGLGFIQIVPWDMIDKYDTIMQVSHKGKPMGHFAFIDCMGRWEEVTPVRPSDYR